MTLKNGLVMTLKKDKRFLSVWQLIHSVIVELSKSLPVEVNNSTIELHLPVDSQYSLPVEALNLIVKFRSSPSSRRSFFFSVHSAAIFFLSFRQK